MSAGGLLRPLLVEMCQLAQRPAAAGRGSARRTSTPAEARLLLHSYAESVELALEDNGVVDVRAGRRRCRSTRGCTGVSAASRLPTPPDRAGSPRSGADGYLDVDTNSPIAPAEVVLYVSASRSAGAITCRTALARGRTVSEPQQGIFGIDLGTTYSVVGYIDETGRAGGHPQQRR